MKTTRILALAAAACGLVLVGCNNQKTADKPSASTGTTTTTVAAAKPVNSKCPMTGETLEGSNITVNYKGKTVGFCCAGCKGKFSALSDADKDAKITAAK